ncbi:hypothetical protein Mp_4g02190 [Marchantia polymorpha subsp. ruderalis]|uniref:Uncharacterized protein n=2 Tax=Marchantia polymorpha TaxID=3197 RepID=A0AAF6B5F7_MARPO|nr:hypothetical protein MARPO_0080s0081 [Marchantia polymorpha]BBN07241.1 hypothetical protein Mp_4g02190 [Marchantia polymorpha subsp. ruderalis]|eukprot:PTQ34466.1 hypothetical protein MARPO_0080s0081 [Marchantia polymorpha]
MDGPSFLCPPGTRTRVTCGELPNHFTSVTGFVWTFSRIWGFKDGADYTTGVALAEEEGKLKLGYVAITWAFLLNKSVDSVQLYKIGPFCLN